MILQCTLLKRMKVICRRRGVRKGEKSEIIFEKNNLYSMHVQLRLHKGKREIFYNDKVAFDVDVCTGKRRNSNLVYRCISGGDGNNRVQNFINICCELYLCINICLLTRQLSDDILYCRL